jgi:hypothetical protein
MYKNLQETTKNTWSRTYNKAHYTARVRDRDLVGVAGTALLLRLGETEGRTGPFTTPPPPLRDALRDALARDGVRDRLPLRDALRDALARDGVRDRLPLRDALCDALARDALRDTLALRDELCDALARDGVRDGLPLRDALCDALARDALRDTLALLDGLVDAGPATGLLLPL